MTLQTQWATICYTFVQIMDHVSQVRWCLEDANFDTDDVMNELLDVEYLECDPLTRREKDTPIHCAVKFANERGARDEEYIKLGEAMAKMLIDAGGDPRVKDKHGRKPAQLCIPATEEIRVMLGKEEYILNEGLRNQTVEQEEKVEEAGPPSDSE